MNALVIIRPFLRSKSAIFACMLQLVAPRPPILIFLEACTMKIRDAITK